MLGRIAWLSFLFPRFVMQRIMPELVGIALQSYFYFQILDISVKVFLSVFPFILLFMSVLFCHYCGRVTFHVFF